MNDRPQEIIPHDRKQPEPSTGSRWGLYATFLLTAVGTIFGVWVAIVTTYSIIMDDLDRRNAETLRQVSSVSSNANAQFSAMRVSMDTLSTMIVGTGGNVDQLSEEIRIVIRDQERRLDEIEKRQIELSYLLEQKRGR